MNKDIELVQVGNGFDVIKYLQNLDQSEYPSLILMDMNMPLLNGKETLDLLKMDDQFKLIPVKMFSTAASPKDTQLIEQKGSEVIRKPTVYEEWKAVAAELAKLCYVLLICSMMSYHS